MSAGEYRNCAPSGTPAAGSVSRSTRQFIGALDGVALAMLVDPRSGWSSLAGVCQIPLLKAPYCHALVNSHVSCLAEKPKRLFGLMKWTVVSPHIFSEQR